MVGGEARGGSPPAIQGVHAGRPTRPRRRTESRDDHAVRSYDMNQARTDSEFGGPRRRRVGLRRGFTLVELLAVTVIIGIILILILTAAAGGIRSAEEKATQTLIAKLENAINDRVEALLQNRQDPAASHLALAHFYGTSANPAGTTTQVPDRAYVIAMIDYLKRELP